MNQSEKISLLVKNDEFKNLSELDKITMSQKYVYEPARAEAALTLKEKTEEFS